jgi:hypothetical protein
MNKPKRIDLSQKQLDGLIERVEAGTLYKSDGRHPLDFEQGR